VAVCICSSSDETSDLETCVFEPMENIQVDGPTHSGPTGVLEHEITWPIVLEVIGRPGGRRAIDGGPRGSRTVRRRA
jgi:hypothetical protein